MIDKKYVVISLFNGMGCAWLAFDKAGIKVSQRISSEIDKYAIKVNDANYPDTIQLGDVCGIEVIYDANRVPVQLKTPTKTIDLLKDEIILVGGSPCQSFSFAGKRKGMSAKQKAEYEFDEQEYENWIDENGHREKDEFIEMRNAELNASDSELIEILDLEHYLRLKAEGFQFEGQSYLFWEYMRILKAVNPKFFFLENVLMGEKWQWVLTKAIGVQPIRINSSLLSAQNRERLYWTNIGLEPAGLFGDLESIIKQPKDKGILLKDILEDEVDEKYFLSEKIMSGFMSHNKRHIEEKGQTGFNWKPTEGNKKGNTLRANAALCPTDNSVIVPVSNAEEVLNPNQLEKFKKMDVDESKAGCLTEAIGRAGSSDEYVSMLKKISKIEKGKKGKKGGKKEKDERSQTEKLLDRTGVDISGVTEPTILDVYNKNLKEDGKCGTLTDPKHGTFRLVIPEGEVKAGVMGFQKEFEETDKATTLMQRDYKGMNNYGINVVAENVPVNPGEKSVEGGDYRSDEGFRWRDNGKSPALTRGSDKSGTQLNSLAKIITHEIPARVSVRIHEVDIPGLQKLLKEHKNTSTSKIAALLNVPKTMAEHWFRTDKHFAIPDADIWMKLKNLLSIKTDEFDKSIMEFEERDGVFEKGNRVYDEEGIAPTLTQQSADDRIMVRKIIQVSDNNKSNGGTQPYQQDRIYDVNGISPALSAGKSDLMIGDFRGDTGFREREDGKSPTLMARAREDKWGPPIIQSGTLRTHEDGNGFREVKSEKGATIPARAREDGSGQNVVKITKINEGQSGQVHDTDGKSVSLCANGGGQGAKTGLYQTQTRIRRLTPVECFVGDTFLIGANKNIKDVNVGDSILSKNGIQKVVHKFERDFQGNVYNIKVQGALPLKATGEHPFLVCEKISTKKGSWSKVALSAPKWEKAENLKSKKYYMLYPKIKGFDSTKYIPLDKYVKEYRNTKKQRKTRKLPRKFHLNKNFCWLLGLCVAEAYMGKETTEISLSKYEVDIIKKCQKELKKIGINSCIVTQGNCSRVVVFSAIFSRFLKEYIGIGALNKKIPDFILYNKNIKHIKYFLDGYFVGDGCERITSSGSHKKECVTISKNLSHQVQIALARLNIFSSIYKSIPKSNMVMGRVCNVKEKYIVSYVVKNKYNVRYKTFDDYIAVPIQNIAKEKFSGKVYNIETSDNTYLASNLITHNCERLQCVPDQYTNHVSDSQRYKMIGNGWTCDVIAYIFGYIK